MADPPESVPTDEAAETAVEITIETAVETTTTERAVETTTEMTGELTKEAAETITEATIEEIEEHEGSIIQMEVPVDQQMATVQLGDLSGHSVQELAEHLPNIGIHFTCKKCNISCNQMSEVLAHFTDGKCNIPMSADAEADQDANKQGTRVRKRGRPRKTETPQPQPPPPLYTVSKEMEYEELPRIAVQSTGTPPSGRRTRYSEGKIKRLDVLTLLGGRVKVEPQDEDEEYNPPPAAILRKRELEDDDTEVLGIKRQRGRPRKPRVEDAPEPSSRQYSEEMQLLGGDGEYASVTIENAGNSKVIVINRTKCSVDATGDGDGDEEEDVATAEIGNAGSQKQKTHAIKSESDPNEDGEEQIEGSTEDRETGSDCNEDDEDDEHYIEEDKEGNLKVRKDPIHKFVKKTTYSYTQLMNKKRQNKCKICKQRFFYTSEELQVHAQCHTNHKSEKESYACISVNCTYRSIIWNRMLDHLITHEEFRKKLENAPFLKNIVGSFTCPICKKKFDRKNNMKGHISKVHFKHDRTCEICGTTMANVDDKTYKRHVEKCQNLLFQCSHCEYRTPVSANMRKHMKIHLGQGFTCEICNSVFPSKQRYAVHRAIHNETRQQFMCDVCGQAFMSSDAVKKHVIRFHTETTVLYNCPECNNFKTKIPGDLKKHIQSVHNKKHQCQHCYFQTNSTSAFEQHDEYHKPGRNYPCTYTNCFYRGATAKQLSNHVGQVHKQTSKHECPVCHKLYKKKTHLARHLVSHTGDKPYVCLDCDAAFSSHSTYYRHRQKTGHDAKREGIVSVPQNITIQYVSHELQPGDEQTQNLIAMTNAAASDFQIVPGSKDVEFVTPTEAIQQEEDDPGEAHHQNIIILENENGEQVTYLLKMSEDDNSIATIVSEDGVEMDAGLAQQIQAQLQQLQEAELNSDGQTRELIITPGEATLEVEEVPGNEAEEVIHTDIVQDGVIAHEVATIDTNQGTVADSQEVVTEGVVVQGESEVSTTEQVEFVTTEEVDTSQNILEEALGDEITGTEQTVETAGVTQIEEVPQDGVLQIETTGENGEAQTLYIVQENAAEDGEGEDKAGEALENKWVQLADRLVASGVAPADIQVQEAATEQQQMIYEESVVEVDNPSGGQGTQYAIVLVPSSESMAEDEPSEAALSMLQLQSGNNVVVNEDGQIIMQDNETA